MTVYHLTRRDLTQTGGSLPLRGDFLSGGGERLTEYLYRRRDLLRRVRRHHLKPEPRTAPRHRPFSDNVRRQP